MMVDANGRFMITVVRSDRPNFASNNRMRGTPDENNSVVQGSIAYYGTYTIDEATRVITVNVESILSVTAREIKSGREASVTIRPSGGLSQREIVEIITRRRREQAQLAVPPEPIGGTVRVTTRDHLVSKPDDEKP